MSIASGSCRALMCTHEKETDKADWTFLPPRRLPVSPASMTALPGGIKGSNEVVREWAGPPVAGRAAITFALRACHNQAAQICECRLEHRLRGCGFHGSVHRFRAAHFDSRAQLFGLNSSARNRRLIRTAHTDTRGGTHARRAEWSHSL